MLLRKGNEYTWMKFILSCPLNQSIYKFISQNSIQLKKHFLLYFLNFCNISEIIAFVFWIYCNAIMLQRLSEHIKKRWKISACCRFCCFLNCFEFCLEDNISRFVSKISRRKIILCHWNSKMPIPLFQLFWIVCKYLNIPLKI